MHTSSDWKTHPHLMHIWAIPCVRLMKFQCNCNFQSCFPNFHWACHCKAKKTKKWYAGGARTEMSAKQIAFGQRLWQLCISCMLHHTKHAHTHVPPQNKLKARKRFNLFYARVFKTNILWPFSYLLSFHCKWWQESVGGEREHDFVWYAYTLTTHTHHSVAHLCLDSHLML